MKKIKLKNTKLKSLVDNEIFIWASKEIWSLQNGKYAVRCSCIKINNQWFTKKIYLHREIIKVTGNFHVDHINGNTLDNRRDNLRIVTKLQNNINVKKQKNCTSKYKGLTLRPSGRWGVYITINKKTICGGTFDIEIDAAKKYNQLALTHFGEYARINKIEE